MSFVGNRSRADGSFAQTVNTYTIPYKALKGRNRSTQPARLGCKMMVSSKSPNRAPSEIMQPSIPQIAFIKLYTVFFEKGTQLVLKANPAVMFPLIQDVLNYFIYFVRIY
jgi:hypothetical protein